MNCKKIFKIFSVFFSVLLILNQIEIMSFATVIEKNEIDDQKENEEVYIIDEDITRRKEFEKHFICSDGNYIAVLYEEPIHYQNEKTNSWENINTNLVFNDITKKYEINNDKFSVSLSNSYEEKEVVSITNEQKYII